MARGWGGRFMWGFGRDVGEERLARSNAVADEGLSFPAEDVCNADLLLLLGKYFLVPLSFT